MDIMKVENQKELLNGVTKTYGVERCGYNVVCVFDKSVKNFDENVNAIVFSHEITDEINSWSLKKRFPMNKYWIIGGEIVGDTFIQYLS